MTYRRRRIRIQKYQGLAEPEHNSVKASPNPDTFHRLRRRPRSTLEQPSGNARFPVTIGPQHAPHQSRCTDSSDEKAGLEGLTAETFGNTRFQETYTLIMISGL